MKTFFIMLGLVAVSVLPVLAKEEPLRELTVEQDAALRDFAASIIAVPLNVQMVATLRPPTTTYVVSFVASDYKNLWDRFEVWGQTASSTQGEWASGSVDHPHDVTWTTNLGCGTWKTEGQTGAWSHPDGEAPAGCPHKQGTSHPGTVTVAGIYTIHVFLATQNPTDSLMTGTWSFTCTYPGSESGTAQCEETLKEWKGRYGSTANGPQQQPRRTAGIAVVVAAVAATAYIYRQRIIRGIRPVLMRDPK